MNKVKSAAEELIDTLVNGTKRSAVELAIKNLRQALDTDSISTVDSNGPSPTAGTNIEERILHVGGGNNAAGYVEFGGATSLLPEQSTVYSPLIGINISPQYRPDIKTEEIRFPSPLYSQPVLPNQAASKEEVYSALTAVDSHDALAVWRTAEKFHRIGTDNEPT